MTLATAGTYPSGGVPIPTGIGKYGLKRKLDYIKIYDTGHGSGHQVKLSATGNVLRIYQVAGYASTASSVQASLVEMATTATAGSGGTMVLYVEAVGF